MQVRVWRNRKRETEISRNGLDMDRAPFLFRLANVFEDKKKQTILFWGRGNCARLFTFDRVEDAADQGQQEDERELHCHLRGERQGTNCFGLAVVEVVMEEEVVVEEQEEEEDAEEEKEDEDVRQ